MSQRTVIIGDVHGCINELDLLLEKLALTAEDRLIFAGDLVNKGPATTAVLKRARDLGAESVLGNHENRLLHFRKGGEPSSMKSRDLKTAVLLDEDDWQFIEEFPLHIELPEYNALVVHGGFLPQFPWREQGPEIVTRVQTINQFNQICGRVVAPNVRYWADSWKGPEFVVYGHTPRREVYQKQHSIGLDTGCVYGGHLTAFTLPDRSIIQVKAQRVYEASAEF